jgi:hypothetical protein
VVVFLARIIDGLTAGNLTVAQAYIADVTDPNTGRDRSASSALRLVWDSLWGPAYPDS